MAARGAGVFVLRGGNGHGQITRIARHAIYTIRAHFLPISEYLYSMRVIPSLTIRSMCVGRLSPQVSFVLLHEPVLTEFPIRVCGRTCHMSQFSASALRR